MRRAELFGRRFVRLLPQDFKNGKWLCVCDCGNTTLAASNALTTGFKQSCGCLHKEVCGKLRRTHGHASGFSHSPTYQSWHAMKQRCYDKNNAHYERYGGRGIRVWMHWVNNFARFLDDMGIRPTGKELSRIDESKDYAPGNVVWETHHDNVQRRDSSNCGPRKTLTWPTKFGSMVSA